MKIHTFTLAGVESSLYPQRANFRRGKDKKKRKQRSLKDNLLGTTTAGRVARGVSALGAAGLAGLMLRKGKGIKPSSGSTPLLKGGGGNSGGGGGGSGGGNPKTPKPSGGNPLMMSSSKSAQVLALPPASSQKALGGVSGGKYLSATSQPTAVIPKRSNKLRINLYGQAI